MSHDAAVAQGRTIAGAPAGGLRWYVAAAALVLVYVQTFALWQALVAGLGAAAASAVPAFAVAALAAGALAAARRRRRAVAWGWVALGAGLVGAALLATDPQFPAKRIHVAQYVLLAWVVERGVPAGLSGLPRAGAAALVAGLFGLHDEFLQGLHPDRSYGLRDAGVNALAALAGALILHGLRGGGRSPGMAKVPPALAAGGAMLAVGLGLLLAGLEAGLSAPAPVWTMLPLLAGASAATLLAADARGPWAETGRVVLVLAAALPLYLLATHVPGLAFR